MRTEECYCDYVTPEVYHQKRQRARKQYTCYECGMPIRKGEMYEHVYMICDGVTTAAKTCSQCLEIRDTLAEMSCFCWSHGGLQDDVVEQLHEAEFQQGARFYVLRLIAKHQKRRRALLRKTMRIKV